MFLDWQLTFNLCGGGLSKWSKLCISIVKLSLFLDRRSKFNSGWCFVRFITNQVLMENDRTSYKFQVFYDPKRLSKWESTWWRFIEMDRTKQFKCVTFFFLGSKVKMGLYTTVCNNRYKYPFLLEMTTFTEILFTFVRRWAINVEFRWFRFMKMDKIVHFKCQTCIIAGSKVKINLCLVLCTFLYKMTEHPLNCKFVTILNSQVNANPRGGVLLKWTELHNSSVLVCFFSWV